MTLMDVSPAVVARELPAAEWGRLLEMPGPYADLGHLPVPEHNRIMVVENAAGEILGYWGVFTTIHVEPLYIRPEHRQRAAVGRKLWEGVTALLRRFRVPGAVAVISDEDAPVNLPMATKLGFQKVPGSLYFLNLVEEATRGEHVCTGTDGAGNTGTTDRP